MNNQSTFVNLLGWALTVLLATFLIYWLWNEVLTRAVIGVRRIDFWQALGISVLARLLFGPNIVTEQNLYAALPLPQGSVKTTTVKRTRR